jgi:ABC-type sugar transport system permease subunit
MQSRLMGEQISFNQTAFIDDIKDVAQSRRLATVILDKLLESPGIAREISIYTTTYCTKNHVGDATELVKCFPSPFTYRVLVNTLYWVSIASTVVGIGVLAFSIISHQTDHLRWFLRCCRLVACVAVFVIILTLGLGTCAVDLLISDDWLGHIIIKTGYRFFALMSGALICLVLVLWWPT